MLVSSDQNTLYVGTNDEPNVINKIDLTNGRISALREPSTNYVYSSYGSQYRKEDDTLLCGQRNGWVKIYQDYKTYTPLDGINRLVANPTGWGQGFNGDKETGDYWNGVWWVPNGGMIGSYDPDTGLKLEDIVNPLGTTYATAGNVFDSQGRYWWCSTDNNPGQYNKWGYVDQNKNIVTRTNLPFQGGSSIVLFEDLDRIVIVGVDWNNIKGFAIFKISDGTLMHHNSSYGRANLGKTCFRIGTSSQVVIFDRRSTAINTYDVLTGALVNTRSNGGRYYGCGTYLSKYNQCIAFPNSGSWNTIDADILRWKVSSSLNNPQVFLDQWR